MAVTDCYPNLCSADSCGGASASTEYVKLVCSHTFCRPCRQYLHEDHKIFTCTSERCFQCSVCMTWSPDRHIQTLYDGAVQTYILNNERGRSNCHPLMIKGIPNIGMSCYISAVLEILSQTPDFYRALLYQENDWTPVSRALIKVISHVNRKSANTGEQTVIQNLHTIRGAIANLDSSFSESVANDSHAFFLCLLQVLQDEGADGAVKLFEGELKYNMHCSVCQNYFSTPEEPYMSLLMPSHTTEITPRVSDSLGHLLAEEIIESRALSCRLCDEKREVLGKTTRRLCITTGPSILVLHLSRFDKVNPHCVKNGIGIAFDKKLDLPKGKYVPKRQRTCILSVIEVAGRMQYYQLYGVIAHYGSLEDGHYVAYVKGQSDNNTSLWYKCSDTEVETCEEQYVLSEKSAYLLFYNQHGQKQPNVTRFKGKNNDEMK